MSFKIPCGGFELDEKIFSLDENDVLSVGGDFADLLNDEGIINQNHLPEGYPYEEVKMVEGDTLTWDGNTEGRASFMEMYYKVSDAIPSLSELGNAVLSTENGEGDTFVGGFSETGTNLLGHNYGLVMIALADNVDFAGAAIIPEKGIYFAGAEDSHVSSLTIPGYTGFETKTIKRMDEKYMPVLTSPNGTKFKISVGDDGSLSAAEVVIS